MRIPVIFCIDVEPDQRLVSRSCPEPWDGFAFTFRYLSDLRSRFEEITGVSVRYSWFFRLDPQVAISYGSASWAFDRYSPLVAEMDRRGDELGVHPHPFRWLPTEGTWLQDFASQGWVEHCVGTSLEAYGRALGRPCRSFRFGDRWINNATLNFAESMGVTFDLTLEPGAPAAAGLVDGEPVSGSIPDGYRVPRRPYTPAYHDYEEPAPAASRALRMVPLSSGHLRHPGAFVRTRLRRLLDNGLRGYWQDTPLSMWRRWRDPNGFDAMLTRCLRAQTRPYLAFAVRTSLGSDHEILDRVSEALRALIQHPLARRFAFSTPAEALGLLTPAAPAPVQGEVAEV